VAMQKTVESVMAMPSDVVERARAAIKVDP
jgi:hypothetical protein